MVHKPNAETQSTDQDVWEMDADTRVGVFLAKEIKFNIMVPPGDLGFTFADDTEPLKLKKSNNTKLYSDTSSLQVANVLHRSQALRIQHPLPVVIFVKILGVSHCLEIPIHLQNQDLPV
jgi:hypothetical protein